MDPEKWCRSDFKLKMAEKYPFLLKEDMAREERRENERLLENPEIATKISYYCHLVAI